MLGVEDQARVEGAGRHVGRRLAGEHVEEVRGVGQVPGGLHRFLAAADPVVGADGRRDLAREPRGLATVGGARVVGGVGIVHPQRGDGRLQRAHRVRVLRHEGEGLRQLARDRPGRDEFGREPAELRSIGQLAMPEEVGHLLERGPARQIVDVIAAVGEPAVLPVQVAEPGLGGHDAFETPDELFPVVEVETPFTMILLVR